MRPISQEQGAAEAEREPLEVWSIVTSLTAGGAEILVSNLSGALVARGITNRVVALCDAATLGNTIEMEANLAEQITRGGGEFVSLGLSRKRGPLEGAAALRKMLAQRVPDVIHCHTARAVAMVALSGFRGSVVLTHHNTRLSFPGYLFRVFDLIVDRYVAISPELEAIYRKRTKRPITLIPNAAAREFVTGSPRSAAHVPCRILSVGAISDQKNYGLVLETAAALRDNYPSLVPPKFSIAGGGQGLEEFRKRSQDMGLFVDVEFLGERSDVRDLMSASDILLNSSTYEGLPIAIIEAMGMALPIIATDVAGNRDLVTDGENGLLAPLHDPQGIAAAIGRVIADPALYQSLSLGAVERSGQFSIDRSADRHLDLYRTADR